MPTLHLINNLCCDLSPALTYTLCPRVQSSRPCSGDPPPRLMQLRSPQCIWEFRPVSCSTAGLDSSSSICNRCRVLGHSYSTAMSAIGDPCRRGEMTAVMRGKAGHSSGRAVVLHVDESRFWIELHEAVGKHGRRQWREHGTL